MRPWELAPDLRVRWAAQAAAEAFVTGNTVLGVACYKIAKASLPDIKIPLDYLQAALLVSFLEVRYTRYL